MTSRSSGSKVPQSVMEDVVIPHLTMKGRYAMVNTKKGMQAVGKLAHLIHWNPVSIAMQCFLHEGCGITGAIGQLTEEAALEWLGKGLGS